MTYSTERILTTHVGSLVRPPELVSLLRAREDGEAVDDQTFADCLRQSVAEVVQQQADAGIDIVSDGEFGKSVSWSRYILERLEGFEDRPDPTRKDSDPHRMLGPRRDTEEFPEFYAEYDQTQGFSGAMRNCICVGPIRYAGRPSWRGTSTTSSPRSTACPSAGSCPSSRRPASPTSARTSTTRARRPTSTPSPTRCGRSTRRSSTPA